ncbi:peptidase S41 [Ornithobacterium rhinotracheale]|uniref:S41 family peptidase n=1 Tax=Ornithobacterium rhinotracheale TaxID=28251 RepID=UPI00129CBC76|nr:S41 family peptidase [Ornithobacterium rhinotracheale]MRI62598.1 peptidase S41 [Ornithobacterium rhinotracheale]
MNIKKSFWLLFLVIGLFSCNSNDDGNNKIGNKGGVNTSGVSQLDFEINTFIWTRLNHFYYWQKDVPKLSDAYLKNENSLVNLLRSEKPNEFFYGLLYKYGEVDRFSWIVDDYHKLLNGLNGISKESGMNLQLSYADDRQNNIVGFVNYVVPGSPADKAKVMRGDVVYEINGQLINKNNYRNLFSDHFKAKVARNPKINETGLDLGNEKFEIDITAVELAENPVAFYKTLGTDSHKVGYLVYNSFVDSYNDELNEKFAQMKSEGVQDLILDLRYNGGGSTRAAEALGAMISGQFGKNYINFTYNEKNKENNQSVNLPSKIDVFQFINGDNKKVGVQDVNTLNLKKVYVLTSHATASASELTITCLKPYIDVVTIGEKTVGKFVFSVTLLDSPNNSFEKINKKHNWAMQPILGAYKNAQKDNYYTGLEPNYNVNTVAFGAFGDVAKDQTLARAIQLIVGGTSKTMSFDEPYRLKSLKINTNTEKPFGTELYVPNFQK